MTEYVWAQYDYGPPINRTITSYEIAYNKKHVNGRRPTAGDVAVVSADLLQNVTAMGVSMGLTPPVPADYEPSIRTRSAH